jgi:hypothetical protein
VLGGCRPLQLDKYIEDSIADDLANVDKVYFNRTEGPKGNFWVITEQTEGLASVLFCSSLVPRVISLISLLCRI